MQDPESKTQAAFKHILFATDFSPASGVAFCYAANIQERYHAQLDVTYVINLEPFDLMAPRATASVLDGIREQARKKIESMLATQGIASDRSRIIVAEGAVAETLTDLVRQNEIDLCVMGTHGRRAFKKLILGSIAEEVFRVASCPVLTIGPRSGGGTARPELHHILYPVDFAPDSSKAAGYAVSLAERYGAKLTILNVREDMPTARNREEAFTEPVESWMEDHIGKQSGLRTRLHFERGFGSASEAILDFASKAAVDLIVIGVRHVDPVLAAHLPKSDTAYELVSRASCPVLSVR